MEGITASFSAPCGAGTTRAAVGASVGPGPVTEGTATLRVLSHSQLLGTYPTAHTVPWAYLCGIWELKEFLQLICAYFVCAYLYMLT